MRHAAVIGILTAVIGVVACSKADPYGDMAADPADLAQASSATCSSKIDGKDPNALKVCTGTKGTKGRCAPKAYLGTFKDTF